MRVAPATATVHTSAPFMFIFLHMFILLLLLPPPLIPLALILLFLLLASPAGCNLLPPDALLWTGHLLALGVNPQHPLCEEKGVGVVTA